LLRHPEKAFFRGAGYGLRAAPGVAFCAMAERAFGALLSKPTYLTLRELLPYNKKFGASRITL
jgi:aspartate aminotransferase-like enzyme